MTALDVRAFTNRNADRLVELLRRNGHHDDPDVEGPGAVRWLAESDEADFLDLSNAFNRSIEA